MAGSNQSLSSWVWQESFWFPAGFNLTWKELENQPGSDTYYPQVKHLHWALPLSLVLLAFRYVWEMFVIVPIGLRLGLSNAGRPKATPVPQLEKVYKKNRKPDHGSIQALSKQTDLTERQVEVWFRKRLKQDILTPMQKFRECSWHLLFYTTYFIYGMVILWNKPYFWKTILCWEGWPKQHVADDIYWYYVVELSFYWSLIVTLASDNKRKDFKEMMIHHFATIVLMYFSWILNFVRVGSLVLVVHDSADTWLALTKMSIYIKKKTATDVFFVIFLVVWIVSRLIIYPFVILYCTTIEPYTANIMLETFGAHQFFNFFLYLLQVLHIIWSYLIFRIVYRKVIKGNVEDVRSDSEEDEDEIENTEDDLDADHTVKNGTNGKVVDDAKVKANGGVTNGYTVSNAEVDDVKAAGDAVKVEKNGVGNGDVHDDEKPSHTNGRPKSPSKIPRARKN